MDKKEAYELGRDRGIAIAERMELPIMVSTPEMYLDNRINEAYEIEQNDRQFSPFEHTAHAFNTAIDPECVDHGWVDYCDNCAWYSQELWDKFDEGINDAFEAVLKERIGL